MNRDSSLTEDENSASFRFRFLTINSIINRVLSYYLLLRSFTSRDLVISHKILLSRLCVIIRFITVEILHVSLLPDIRAIKERKVSYENFIQTSIQYLNRRWFWNVRKLERILHDHWVLIRNLLKDCKHREAQWFFTSIKLSVSKREKEVKRMLNDERKDLQATVKNESESNSLRKKRRIVLSSITNHNLYLISNEFEEDETLKHLELLKDFLVHAKTYRTVTTQTLMQLKSLLRINSVLQLIYDQLRASSNLLIEKQTILRESLKDMLLKKN